jgi:hypothetical protein
MLFDIRIRLCAGSEVSFVDAVRLRFRPPDPVVEDGGERHPQQVRDQKRRGPPVDPVDGRDGRDGRDDESPQRDAHQRERRRPDDAEDGRWVQHRLSELSESRAVRAGHRRRCRADGVDRDD